MSIKRICVIGLGYIGLPTASLLACKGFEVVGVDTDALVVDTINKGEIHIVEPELSGYVERAVNLGLLRAVLAPEACDVYMICVPTPFRHGSGDPEPDLGFVFSAVRSISGLLKDGDLVILESTSPVGTTDKIMEFIEQHGMNRSHVHLAYCPERVLPGKIMSELVLNDRIVGGTTVYASKIAADFYRTFVEGEVFETDARTAELCKLTENSFRDVNIAFANELSIICDSEGINVWELIQLANRHPRVNILQPGPGVGGHCIAVDPWFIVAKNPTQSLLIKTARERNNYKTKWALERINSELNRLDKVFGRRPVVACLGLAFKPDIDDLRESPAAIVAEELLSSGVNVVVVEPNIVRHEKFKVVDLGFAIDNADLLVILVRHRQFLSDLVKEKLKDKSVMDFCGVLRNL